MILGDSYMLMIYLGGLLVLTGVTCVVLWVRQMKHNLYYRTVNK